MAPRIFEGAFVVGMIAETILGVADVVAVRKELDERRIALLAGLRVLWLLLCVLGLAMRRRRAI